MSDLSSLFSPTIARGRSRVAVAALVLGFVLEMLFMASYTGALHNPDRTPHGLPIAVAGPAATRYASALTASAPAGAFTVTGEPSLAAARRAVQRDDVYAALVPTSSGGTELIVADAAGAGVASQLSSRVSAAFREHGQRLTVVHVARLSSGDPRGISPFYAALSWVFGGYLGAIVLSLLAGATPNRRMLAWRRVGALALYAAVSGLAGAVLVGPVLGAITGHLIAVATLGALIVFAVATITLGLEALIGIAGTAVALLLFLIASNPSSGGPVVAPSLPGVWRAIGAWLPTGAGTTSVRNAVYFQGAHLTQPLLLLAGFAVAGIELTLTAAARQGRRASTADPAPPEALDHGDRERGQDDGVSASRAVSASNGSSASSLQRRRIARSLGRGSISLWARAIDGTRPVAVRKSWTKWAWSK